MSPLADSERDLQQAEQLDAYLAASPDGGATPPAGLDPALAATARRLATGLGTVRARPEFAASLAKRLEAQATAKPATASPALPATEASMRPQRTHEPRTAEPRRGLVRSLADLLGRTLTGAAWVVPAALLLILTIIAARPLFGGHNDVAAGETATAAPTAAAVAITATPPPTVTPAPTATQAVAAPYHSLRLQQVTHYQVPGAADLVTSASLSYQAPNLWRTETEQTSADGADRAAGTVLAVSDGVDMWNYSPTGNSVAVYPASAGVDPLAQLYATGAAVDSLEALQAALSDCGTPQVVGEAVVAGRSAYQIDLGPNLCPSAAALEANGKTVLWVDKETFVTLKQETYNTAGDTVLMSSEVTSIEYDVDLDPALFTFVPPADALVSDFRPGPALGPEEYLAQLSEMAAQVDYPLFAPSTLAGDLAPRHPTLLPGGVEATQVQLTYVPAGLVESESTVGEAGFTVVEQKATYAALIAWTDGAQPVDVPQGKAWVREGEIYVDGTGSGASAVALRDGTLVALNSFSIAAGELVKVVAGLEVVPGSHAALPEPTAPTLAEVRAQAPYPVFVPTWVPEGLTPEPPVDYSITYHRADGSVALTVTNVAAGNGAKRAQQETGVVTLANGIGAGYVEAKPDQGGSLLTWEQGGTAIYLSATGISRDDLVRIADSMSSTADLGATETPPVRPTPTPEPAPAVILRPTWLPAEMTVREQVDGQTVVMGFDPNPEAGPHDVMVLAQAPLSTLDASGGTADPQQTVDTIGGREVTVIHRQGGCTMYQWDQDGIRLVLTNAYDPPGALRWTREEMAQVVASVQ